jgi:hypothetical protein
MRKTTRGGGICFNNKYCYLGVDQTFNGYFMN